MKVVRGRKKDRPKIEAGRMLRRLDHWAHIIYQSKGVEATMQDPNVIRKLYYLANRLEANAAIIRGARIPSHLHPAKRRMLRHLAELNHIRDKWADGFKPTRRKKQTRPMITQYDRLSHWNTYHKK